MKTGDTNLRHKEVMDADEEFWNLYSDAGLVFKPDVVMEGRIKNHSNVHAR